MAVCKDKELGTALETGQSYTPMRRASSHAKSHERDSISESYHPRIQAPGHTWPKAFFKTATRRALPAK